MMYLNITYLHSIIKMYGQHVFLKCNVVFGVCVVGVWLLKSCHGPRKLWAGPVSAWLSV